MDIFIEELVKKRRESKDYAVLAVLILGGLIISVALILLMLYATLALGELSQIAGSIGMLLIAAAWYAVFYIYNSSSIEYEYIVVNNNLDIDKIMAKKRRKNVIELDIKNATVMACIDDEENNFVYKNINSSVKVLDLSAKNPNLYTYFIDYSTDGKREIILFQPTSKMVEALWKFNPKAVKKYNI
ncbi:MAG: hypothetical protein IJC09_05015 [Clostridia bacterium]|nr:hypothetical protein [Clostridia bacterium]